MVNEKNEGLTIEVAPNGYVVSANEGPHAFRRVIGVAESLDSLLVLIASSIRDPHAADKTEA